ncbi:GTP cyclohydrolase I [Selenomonas sp. AE3005]|uniref:GTP cyclohydrolase I n=1 Tax=Selenomonas sp. AE3005 TaxID=1485543 RepID=UPI000489B79B|nr:GTP cyclohydrolase I [Selenomonas sp. AE3005]
MKDDARPVDKERAARAMRDFLEAVGVDLQAQGMEKTPERVAKMYEYLFNGMGKGTSDIWGETFDAGSEGIVAVRHVPFYSMCEHHLVPFFGEVSIAYLPGNGRVAGFSKFSQLVERLSHKPQLQERLAAQIAAAVRKDLGARGVLVVIEAQQLCMTMRGDLAHGTRTVTSECNGVFKEDTALYQQAWMILGGEKA